MAPDRGAEPVLAGGAGRADGREDAAAGGVQLLVARAGRAERELLDAVAPEARVRVAVDEPGDRAEAAPVELDDVAVERGRSRHPADGDDRVAVAEDVRVVEPLDVAERAPRSGAPRAGRRRQLLEVADEQARRRAARAHSRPAAGIGGSRPCSAAAATASS